MATYEARFYSRTGTTGPLVSVLPKYDRALNGRGMCEFTLKIDQAGLTSATTLPWANEIVLLRNGTQVVHDGPITRRHFNAEQRTVTITAGPVAAWLGKRHQRRDVALSYTSTDLDTIARDIITMAQQPEGTYDADTDFGVTSSANLTGETIDLAVPATDRRNWRELLDELAEAEPGFDWDIETTVTGGVRSREFQTWYPSRGQTIDTRLILGSNLIGLEVTDDGEQAANHIEVFGSGGAANPSGIYTSIDQDVYGVLEYLDTGSNLSTYNALNRRAAETRRLRRPNPRLIQAGYRVSDATPFRFATLGDNLLIEAELGILSMAEYHPEYATPHRRVVAEDVTVNPGGDETVMLTLMNPLPL